MSPPPTSVSVEGKDDEHDVTEDGDDDTTPLAFKTPHTTLFPEKPFEVEVETDSVCIKADDDVTDMTPESESSAAGGKKTLQFHTPADVTRRTTEKRPPMSSRRRGKSTDVEAQAQAPCGASDSEEDRYTTGNRSELDEKEDENEDGSLPDGAAWESEAAVRDEMRQEARVELWEELRELLLEEVKDVDGGILDDIARRLELRR